MGKYSIQIHKYTSTQIHKYTNTQIHKNTSSQIHKYSHHVATGRLGEVIHHKEGNYLTMHPIKIVWLWPKRKEMLHKEKNDATHCKLLLIEEIL